MLKKLFFIFLILILFVNIFNIYKTYATEVEEAENIVEENIINEVDVLHNDLSAIFSILVFFTVVLLCCFAYKFLNMFFTI